MRPGRYKTEPLGKRNDQEVKDSESTAVKGKPFQKVKDGKVLLGHVSRCPYKCMREREHQQKRSGLEHHTLAEVAVTNYRENGQPAPGRVSAVTSGEPETQGLLNLGTCLLNLSWEEKYLGKTIINIPLKLFLFCC